MRIAQIAPLYEDVPPRTYGGTERVIAALCDGLVARGHDVTLFATGGSQTDARLESVISASLRVRMNSSEMADIGGHLHLRMLADVYGHASDFDVIHSHIDLTTLPFVESSVTPTVLTLHGRLDTPVVQRVLPMYPGVPLVSISDHQRVAVDGLAGRMGGDRAQRPRSRPVPPAAPRGWRVPRLRRTDHRGEATRSRGRGRPTYRLAAARCRQGRSGRRRLLTTVRSSRCSIRTRSTTSANSTKRPNLRSTPAPRRRSSPAIGRSRSVW